MSANHEWLIWALLSAFFAALTAIFAKLGVRDLDPDLATFYRTWVVLAFLALIVFSAGKWQSPVNMDFHAGLFILLSGLATGLSWLCYFRALKLAEASRVAPIDKFSVVLVALLAIPLLGERPSSRDWAGILLITAGVILVSLKK